MTEQSYRLDLKGLTAALPRISTETVMSEWRSLATSMARECVYPDVNNNNDPVRGVRDNDWLGITRRCIEDESLQRALTALTAGLTAQDDNPDLAAIVTRLTPLTKAADDGLERVHSALTDLHWSPLDGDSDGDALLRLGQQFIGAWSLVATPYDGAINTFHSYSLVADLYPLLPPAVAAQLRSQLRLHRTANNTAHTNPTTSAADLRAVFQAAADALPQEASPAPRAALAAFTPSAPLPDVCRVCTLRKELTGSRGTINHSSAECRSTRSIVKAWVEANQTASSSSSRRSAPPTPPSAAIAAFSTPFTPAPRPILSIGLLDPDASVPTLLDSGAGASVIDEALVRAAGRWDDVDTTSRILLTPFNDGPTALTAGCIHLSVHLPVGLSVVVAFHVTHLPSPLGYRAVLALGDLRDAQVALLPDGSLVPFTDLAAIDPSAGPVPFQDVWAAADPLGALVHDAPDADPADAPPQPRFGDLASASARRAISSSPALRLASASEIVTAGPTVPPGDEMPLFQPRLRPDADLGKTVSPVFAQPPVLRRITVQLIEELLDLGVFAPAPPRRDTPDIPYFCARAFVVRKPSGRDRAPDDPKGYRLVVDLRLLNEALADESDPSSSMPMAFASIPPDATVFSSLDLRASFYSLPLHPDSQPLTRFRAHGYPLTLMCTRASMGLKVSSSYLSAAVAILVADLPGVVVYCDDLLLAHSSVTEQVAVVLELLQRATRLGFQFSLAKCTFLASEVEFLGRLVSASGSRIAPAFVSALADIQPAKTTPQLRALLGFLNFFRPFIPDASALLEPLSSALRKGRRSTWTPAMSAALQTAVAALSSAAELALYPPSPGPLLLFTDASASHMGAALTTEGHEPLAFWSRALSPAQRRYSIADREALAIVESLRALESTTRGYRITVFTDHKGLEAVFAPDDARPRADRVARWAQYLSTRDVYVQYLPGRDNAVADLFSRPAAHPAVPVAAIQAAATPVSPITEAAADAHAQGHPGPKPLAAALVALGFSKRASRKAARATCAACTTCHRVKTSGSTPALAHRSHPTPPAANIWVFADAAGPFPLRLGHASAVVIVDAFSRLARAWVVPSRGVSGSDISAAVRAWTEAYGAPLVLASDNAQAFRSHTLAATLASASIEHHLATPRKPDSMGRVERVIQSLKDKVRAELSEANTGLPSLEALETAWRRAVAAYNSTLHSSTGETPAFLFFGRDDARELGSFSDVPARASAARSLDADVAARRAKAAGLVDPAWPGSVRRATPVSVGQWVFLRRDRAHKLGPPYAGPFAVVAAAPAGTAVTIRDRAGDERRVPLARLRLWQAPTPPPVSELPALRAAGPYPPASASRSKTRSARSGRRAPAAAPAPAQASTPASTTPAAASAAGPSNAVAPPPAQAPPASPPPNVAGPAAAPASTSPVTSPSPRRRSTRPRTASRRFQDFVTAVHLS